MEWWIIVPLAGVALMFMNLYRIALRENRQLTNYALLVLLDETVLSSQRKSLAEFARASNAKNAGELGSEAYLATTRLAGRLPGYISIGGLLWKIKNAPVQS
jgi:hypothetical protein